VVSAFEKMSKGGFDVSELQQGAKGLHHVRETKKASSKGGSDEDAASISQLGSCETPD
jgi:hypothetical protein